MLKTSLVLILLAFSCSFPQAAISQESHLIAGNVNMSESRKKQIFKELVKLQDSGYGKEKSESIIKERYNITSSELLSILLEGYKKDWLSGV